MKKQRCIGCDKLLPFTDEFFNIEKHKSRCLKCRKIRQRQNKERELGRTVLVFGSVEYRKHMSEAMRNSPRFQAVMKSTKYRARKRAEALKRFQNPIARIRHSKAVRNSPRVQAARIEPSYCVRLSQRMLKQWRDPAYRARMEKRIEARSRLYQIGAELLRGNNAPKEQRRNQSYCYWLGYEFAKRSGLRNDPLFKPLIKED
jgi:hypothetical protein